LKKQLLPFVVLLAFSAAFLIACKKNNNEDNPEASLFYGKWKTSYGDTIIFSSSNNKNMLNYDISLNPAFAPRANNEYTYKDQKLGVKDGFGSPGSFRFFDSFRWIQRGSEFEIQGIQWFMFISSMGTYFTFTKIN
jgi:hypothetical protein